MALYAGFPAAINAMQAVKEAFEEYDKQNPGSIKPAGGIDIHKKKAISA
jgi:hypothetical protein